MDIIISGFKAIKEILEFIVVLINIYMFLELKAQQKRIKSKPSNRHKKKVLPKRKHRKK